MNFVHLAPETGLVRPASGPAPDGEPRLRTILACVAAFAVIWGVYFAIAEAPAAIKHDMAEAYAWGQEFQLGYNQHPPFWAWICGAWFLVFPHTQWAFSFLSSINSAIGLWGCWALIGDFVAGKKRVAAWAMLLLVPASTYYAYKYDANIIFLSVWPWTLHWFLRSVRSRRIGDGVGFGVCMAMALMSKYYALILAVTCLISLLWHPLRWRYLSSAAPYVAIGVCGLLCVPHIWWLFTNNAPPIAYLESKSGWPWWYVGDAAAKTAVGAVGMQLGLVVPVALTLWRRLPGDNGRAFREVSGCDMRILATMSLAPVLLTLVSGLAIRTPVTLEMTQATYPLVPLLLIELIGMRDVGKLCRISVRIAVGLCLGSLILAPGICYARTWYLSEGRKALPFQEVALTATKLWHTLVGTKLDYVTGTVWYENETAFYSPDHPHAFVGFDFDHSLWVTPEKLARHGLLVICRFDDRTCLDDSARFATPQSTRIVLTLAHHFIGHMSEPRNYVLTIIPPRVH
ncbi:MAG TPA: glycosyltransferase family 39 protein [Acetobacteraceae bacterium]|jgi:hypothetical protein|nr:glycosyltransferase family 39 protein [Acetobacteraceae bacterium]